MRGYAISWVYVLCLVALGFGAACSKVQHQTPGVGEEDASTAADSGDGDDAGSGGNGGAAGASGKSGAGVAGRCGSPGSSARCGTAGASGTGSSSGAAVGDAGSAGRGDAGTGASAGRAGNLAGRGGSSGNAAGSSGGAAVGRCGTRGGVMCSADQFCKTEPDAGCGSTDLGGKCEAKPQVCPDIYAPVCGCDGKTYSSDCNAHAMGVSIEKAGTCASNAASTGKTCGGFAALDCDPGQFCNYEKAAGGQGCDGQIADAAGKCEVTPTGCGFISKPSCGCDRRSYGNPCEAHMAGVSVLHDGACTEKDCMAIGGRVAPGQGPAPKCDAGETEHGYVVADNGSMFTEGALCCLR